MDSTIVRDRLRAYVRTELMGRPDYPLGDDERLVEGGLIDSFHLVYLGVFIETTFGVHISEVDLAAHDLDSIAQLADYIAASSRT